MLYTVRSINHHKLLLPWLPNKVGQDFVVVVIVCLFVIDVVRYRQKFGPPHKIELTKEVAKQDNNEGEEFDSGDLYCKVFSESEDDDDVRLV